MQKQIDEVMALVDSLAEDCIAAGIAQMAGSESAREQIAVDVRKGRAEVESKLRELLPVWIDAKEKMPPVCTDVIAYGRKYGDKQKRKRVFKTYISTRPHECVEDEEISHWMPLPKAPE